MESEMEVQVLAFKTVKALERHAKSLQLTRVNISDISRSMDMRSSYMGGQVEESHAQSYSQGHTLSIFVRDDSVSDTQVCTQDKSCQLLIAIDGAIADQLPSILAEEFKLFVVGTAIKVSSFSQMFSQDHACRLEVKGPNAKIWIVHKDANKAGFFDRRVCSAAWFEKQKKRDEIELEPATSKATTDKASEESQNDEFSLSCNSDVSQLAALDVAEEGAIAKPRVSVPQPKLRKKNGANYEYKTLAEVKGGDKKVNVIAVVSDLSEPAPTRGTDIYCLMRLIDESCPSGIKCISFARSAELLPKVRRCGDILSLHRVYVEEYNNSLQIVCNGFCSTLRFSGHVGRSLRPLTTSVTYTLTKSDKRRVKELRTWYQQGHCTISKLKDITIDGSFELICQLVQISEKDSHKVLTVWDGTKATLSLHAQETATAATVKSRDTQVLRALSFGFMHQVVIKDSSLCQTVSALKPGCVLRIKTITIERDELCLPDTQCNCVDVVQLTDPAHSRLLASLRRAGNSAPSVTTTPNLTAPYITVSSLCNRTNVPLKAHLRVKMICMVTPCLEDMVHLRCSQCGLLAPLTLHTAVDSEGVALEPCPHCPQKPFPNCSYDFQVAVADESGEVAILHANRDKAVRLLGGLVPTNLYRNQSIRYELLHRLYFLTGQNNPFNLVTEKPRPWIDCCVFKHQHDGCYYNIIFDTNLEQFQTIDS